MDNECVWFSSPTGLIVEEDNRIEVAIDISLKPMGTLVVDYKKQPGPTSPVFKVF